MIKAVRHRLVLLLCLPLWLSGPASADRPADMDRLLALMAFDQTVLIMREEGLRYGQEIARDLLPDADLDNWRQTVSRIYDSDKMFRLISAEFRVELQGAMLAPMIDYLETAEGQEIVALELAARRSFLDPEAEKAAVLQYQTAKREGTPLVALVARIIDDSDLIEFNVMGALNASMMFYRGLNDGGAYAMSEEEILADVWAQEQETRNSSGEWLGAFLTLAYQPLDPAQIEGYAAFYRTLAGRELNRATFAAFDGMYEELSYLLGRAVAEHLTSEPL